MLVYKNSDIIFLTKCILMVHYLHVRGNRRTRSKPTTFYSERSQTQSFHMTQ
jgi:hypothetical protein